MVSVQDSSVAKSEFHAVWQRPEGKQSISNKIRVCSVYQSCNKDLSKISKDGSAKNLKCGKTSVYLQRMMSVDIVINVI